MPALVVRSHLAASFGHLQIDDAERYENPKAANVADHPAIGPKASCGPLLVNGEKRMSKGSRPRPVGVRTAMKGATSKVNLSAGNFCGLVRLNRAGGY
jgi:hypothetical protein